MLEKQIIEHAAPTLAGLKTANMFSYKFFSKELLEKEVEEGNQKLNKKGVYIEVLKICPQRALIYVYRRQKLESDLASTGVETFLRWCGYKNNNLKDCLEHLKKRIEESESFPHEVGVFLGYPLHDVVGFIEHKGKNYKCYGLWKVYDNEKETVKLFTKFKKCTEVYQRVFEAGRTITQMTVAA
ncbi:MAG: DUF3793 family protein [Ruminococcus sp.]|nr:DUF3793 family protein [Ruminococcus sp.]